MKIFLGILFLVVALFGGSMFWQAIKSRTNPGNTGIEQGLLKECSDKPNCVSSLSSQSHKSFIKPLHADNIEVVWDNLQMGLHDLGLTPVTSQENYIHCTAKTPLLKFVDDVEFLLDRENGIIHIKSESRVGYSDLGANRNRVEAIRKKLQL